MSQYKPLAEELNSSIKLSNPHVYNLLSESGKAIFYPSKGILQQAAEAKGKRINATIGMACEDDGEPIVLSTINEKINYPTKLIVPYAPSIGLKELREEWKSQINLKNPSIDFNYSTPVVAAGVTHSLSLAGYLFLNPEDELICGDCFWGNYRLAFEHNYNASIKNFCLFKDGKFNIESLREVVTNNPEKRKVIVLNFPNNPSGYSPTNEDVDNIVELFRELTENQELVVVLDDAYFGLFYEDNVYKESLFAKLGNLSENLLCVKADGATKEDFAWGIRVGFITFASKGMTKEAYQALELKASGAIRGMVSSCSRLSQQLILDSIQTDNYQKEKQEKFSLLQSRYQKVKEVLKDEKYLQYFKTKPFNSGYFMCLELNEGINAEEIRQDMLDNLSIGVISIGDRLLRISYASIPEADVFNIFEGIYESCKSKS